MSGMVEGWDWSHEEQLGLRRARGDVGGGCPGLSTQQVKGLSSLHLRKGRGMPFWCRKRTGSVMAALISHAASLEGT